MTLDNFIKENRYPAWIRVSQLPDYLKKGWRNEGIFGWRDESLPSGKVTVRVICVSIGQNKYEKLLKRENKWYVKTYRKIFRR